MGSGAEVGDRDVFTPPLPLPSPIHSSIIFVCSIDNSKVQSLSVSHCFYGRSDAPGSPWLLQR